MPYAAKQHRSTPKRDNRPNANQRGYGSRWQRFRVWYLSRHPFCADCEQQGRLTKADEVHHIQKVAKRPELQYVESNCMGLCKRCHSRRTIKGE